MAHSRVAGPSRSGIAASISQSGENQRPWLALAGGAGFCIAIAVVAKAVGVLAPLIGAPIFAIAIGVIFANAPYGQRLNASLRIQSVSGWALRGGIVLLGTTLDLKEVGEVGFSSLSLLATTITAGLFIALAVGARIGVEWRVRCLIGIGTVICGDSAIAALAPVIRAKKTDITYAISVVFLFNMVAVIVFPAIGHVLDLSDRGFGLWAGTAVNDTSAVVATGFAFSEAAGTYATVVKLTRTTLIVPLVVGFALLMPWLEEPEHGADQRLLGRLRKAVPWFVGPFVVGSLLNSAGLVGGASPALQNAARFVLLVALAAVGLQAHWRAFAGTGVRPVLLGLGTWVMVVLTSLVVQIWTSQL